MVLADASLWRLCLKYEWCDFTTTIAFPVMVCPNPQWWRFRFLCPIVIKRLDFHWIWNKYWTIPTNGSKYEMSLSAQNFEMATCYLLANRDRLTLKFQTNSPISTSVILEELSREKWGFHLTLEFRVKGVSSWMRTQTGSSIMNVKYKINPTIKWAIWSFWIYLL